MPSIYRGSQKHKDRPGVGAKGTLCPEWTHTTDDKPFAGDPFEHPWETTAAHRLFASATIHSNGKRFATARGIAFEAKPTADGTWHGFPIPWESVPPDILAQWLEENKVMRKQVRLHKHHAGDDIHWALGGDEI